MTHASETKSQNLKKKEKKQYCNKFKKDVKNGPHQKKIDKEIKLAIFPHPLRSHCSEANDINISMQIFLHFSL